MVGQINPHSREVTVVGGGISGLLCSYYLTKAGYTVTLYEAGPRWGGLIQTTHTAMGIAESAAHALLITPPVEKLFAELGVPLVGVNPESKARWILRDGKMRQFPLSLSESIKAALKATFTFSSNQGPLTLTEWSQNHLGQPALDYLINPMLRGIFGAGPNEILVNAAFSDLVVPKGQSLAIRLFLNSIKKRISSVRHSKPKMMAPKEGMESLISGLERYLKNYLNDRMNLNHSIQELPQVENLVLAVPPQKAAELIVGEDPRLAEALQKVSWASLATTTVFLQKAHLRKIPQGVGVLMPAIENRLCLGILFNSSSFDYRVNDPENWISLTIISSLSTLNEHHSVSEASLLEDILSELASLFGWNEPIKHFVMTQWPEAIPLYNQNLVDVWNLARKGWSSQPGRVLAGNYTGDVSIRGMIEAAAVL